MTVVARRIASTPARTASQTWAVIVNLLAPTDGPARNELMSIGGVAAALIASEAALDDAILVWGAGPRVRVYCLFGEDPVAGEDKNEEPLVTCPTDGDWSMSLPSPPEDLEWVQGELSTLSKRVTARELGDNSTVGSESKSTIATDFHIDEDAFFKP